ncbi:MAG: hypothetical protein RL662_1185 [Bacteroidota bacterium]|jgi:hypothetical protein
MKKSVVFLGFLLVLGNLSYAQKIELFKNNNKYGIKEDGKTLIKAQYEDIAAMEQNLYAVKMLGKYGLVTKYNSPVIAPIYDELKSFGNNLFLVRLGTNWGLIDRFNDTILPIQYAEFKFITDYLCEVKLDGKLGLINRYGNVIISTLYDDITPFSENYYLVKQNGKLGLIDLEGKVVVRSDYDTFDKMPNTTLYRVQKDGKLGIMEASGKFILEAKYDSIQDSSVGRILFLDKKIGFRTSVGKVIEPAFTRIVFEQPELGLIVFKVDNKLGFITSRGVFIEAEYDNISRFSDRGVAFVEKAGKLMAINVNGKELVLQEIMQNRPPID